MVSFRGLVDHLWNFSTLLPGLVGKPENQQGAGDGDGDCGEKQKQDIGEKPEPAHQESPIIRRRRPSIAVSQSPAEHIKAPLSAVHLPSGSPFRLISKATPGVNL
jgi:hypothetical protein